MISPTCSHPGSTAASWCCAASTGRRRRSCWTRSSATRPCTRSATGKTCAAASIRTTVFYSISNCQRGLAGVSFGNFLIKQVVEEICREMPKLSTFVTLSPVTNFTAWLARERAQENSAALSEADKALFAALDDPNWWRDEETAARLQDPLMCAAAWYFLRARGERGLPVDAVARFHLGNGARAGNT